VITGTARGQKLLPGRLTRSTDCVGTVAEQRLDKQRYDPECVVFPAAIRIREEEAGMCVHRDNCARQN